MIPEVLSTRNLLPDSSTPGGITYNIELNYVQLIM